MDIRNRIVGAGDVDPAELTPHEDNWRTHPVYQREALAEVLDAVGWVQDVIVNRATGRMLDGHLRREVALARGEATIPVKYVDLSEAEEALVLATFDPIGAMAGLDAEALDRVLEGVEHTGDAVEALLGDLRDGAELEELEGAGAPVEPGSTVEIELADLNAPFPYFGGKSRVAGEVWARLGDVDNFVEPFAGSAAVLLKRPHDLQPYQVETINDADGYVANFWRAMTADPQGVIDAADGPVIELDLHAWNKRLIRDREAFTAALRADPNHYDAAVAGRWLWGVCAWIGDGWARDDLKIMPDLGNKGRGVHKHSREARVSRETVAAMLEPIAARLRAVRVCCGDWARVLGPSALWPNAANRRKKIAGVFLDPPYMEGDQQYAAGGVGTSLALDVLAWCEQWGEEPTLRIALCGYEGHYDALAELGWSKVRWKASGGYGSQSDGQGRENSGREVVWFSPACLDA